MHMQKASRSTSWGASYKENTMDGCGSTVPTGICKVVGPSTVSESWMVPYGKA